MVIKMSISTDLYRTFFGVGLHLSFSKAAKDIGVSQSAISQSIKQLEKELKITLFERTTKSVAFTPEGKELFDTVAKAFSILDNGVTQLQERVTHEQESLKLAATDTLCRHFLLPYFKEWQEQEKETGLQITNRPSPQCVQMVLDREAQLAVVNNYDELMADPQLEVIELAPMRDVFVGGPAYANAGEFDEERLLQEPLLLLSQGAASRTFFDEITNHRCKKPAFELGSLDVLLDLVEINMGISLVPDMLLKNRLKEGKVVEIKTNIVVPERKTVLVRSRLTPISRAASKFIDLLVK
ncbi:LysR family transcriptional regulator [Veillonella magna]|nr:LysR family transcriptional regulator [uncultured Veillonella sp.]